jgi:GalNAc-alpha-(1->4)-GalNAc-alpha-(1->3)-diNAcBac-PP-undecaprenol alpha-1,4-N-acetyl-D-galactosaminyltransferase
MADNFYDLLFIMPHMGLGGAQRVASYMLDYWAQQGRKICLLTLMDNRPDAFTIDPRVERICISRNRSLPFTIGTENDKRKHFYQNIDHQHFVRKNFSELYILFLYKTKNFRSGLKKSYLKLPFDVLPLSNEAFIQISEFFFRFKGKKTISNIRKLRRVVMEKKPMTIISFLGRTNIQTLIALHDRSNKLIISERNDPSKQRLSPPWQQMRRCLYRSADIVTANSKGAIESMKAFVPEEKLFFIPNPVNLSTSFAFREKRRKKILAVARLVKQKGIDILIKAFGFIRDSLPDWHLEIIGDGKLSSELHQLADQNKILPNTSFKGYQSNISPFYRQASIFVLPSRYEGTPNVLLEALSYGLPAIVSDASSGPLELVKDGQNGYVFPNEDFKALAEKILILASDERARLQMGESSLKVASKFSIENVMAKWEQIL